MEKLTISSPCFSRGHLLAIFAVFVIPNAFQPNSLWFVHSTDYFAHGFRDHPGSRSPYCNDPRVCISSHNPMIFAQTQGSSPDEVQWPDIPPVGQRRAAGVGDRSSYSVQFKQVNKLGSRRILTAPAPNNLTMIKDREILVEFKRALIDDSEALISWNTSANPSVCSGWAGVMCNVFQRVAILDLSGNQLIGPISPVLGNLSFMNNLDLSNNSFNGRIPTSLGLCSALLSLDLSFNSNLSGSIPRELGRCTSLSTLVIEHTNITGTIPSTLGNCSRLTDLIISGNSYLGGSIPDSLGLLTNMQFLNLSGNQLTGSIPNFIGILTELIRIDLSGNQLTGSLPPEMRNLRNLQHLDLSQNKLMGSIPQAVGNWTSLTYLDLSSSALRGEIPSNLGNCTALQFLNLNDNSLSGPISVNFSGMKFLLSVELSSNNLSGTFPVSLAGCAALQLLDLRSNQLSGEIPGFSSDKMNSLRILRLDANHLEGAIPTWIWGLPRLQFLCLSHNSFNGGIPDEWIGLPGMADVPEDEESLYNPESGQIIVIKGVNANYPYFLPFLTSIDVSVNDLTGDVPSRLGTLTSLSNLNLSHNQFTGTLNESLGSIKSLGALDVSSNMLSGHIPSTLSNLNSLGMMSMINNKLSGQIPTENNFDTRYDNSSYTPGNEGLCGRPLTKQCTSNPAGAEKEIRAPHTGFSEIISIPALEIGAAFGFCFVSWSLVLSKRARRAFFSFVNLPDTRVYDREYADSRIYHREYGVFCDRRI